MSSTTETSPTSTTPTSTTSGTGFTLLPPGVTCYDVGLPDITDVSECFGRAANYVGMGDLVDDNFAEDVLSFSCVYNIPTNELLFSTVTGSEAHAISSVQYICIGILTTTGSSTTTASSSVSSVTLQAPTSTQTPTTASETSTRTTTTASLTSTSETSASTLTATTASETSSTTVHTTTATSTFSATSSTTGHSTTVTATLTSTSTSRTSTASSTASSATASSTSTATTSTATSSSTGTTTTATSSSVTTTTASSTTAGEQTLGGSLSMSVDNASHFVNNPVAHTAVTSALATTLGLTQQQTDDNLAVTLSVARRLGHADESRQLSGEAVSADFVLTLEAGSQSSNADSLVSGLSDSVSDGSFTTTLTSALSDAGISYNLTVTGIVAGVYTSTTTISTATTMTGSTTETTMTGSTSITSTTTISTSTITTTTQATMSLSVAPEQLSACVPLLMRVQPPDSAETLEWSCVADVSEGADSPLCVAVLDAVEQQVQRRVTTGALVAEVTLSEDTISAAASSTTSQHPDVDSISITIKVNALRANESLVQAEQTIVFSPDGAPHLTSWQSVDYLGGPVSFSLTDDYVILSVSYESCGATVSFSGDVLWSWRSSGSESWTYVQTDVWSRFVLALDQFGGSGDYQVQCEVTGGDILDTLEFNVTIDSAGPPEAIVTVPSVANAGCGMSFDASASTDPLGEPLNFSWSCNASANVSAQDAAKCHEAVQTTGPVVVVPGNAIEIGTYTITVVATRADGSSGSASANVEITSRDTPTVTVDNVPEQVSPQLDMDVGWMIYESGGCAAPSFKAWYLIDEDDPSVDPIEVFSTTRAIFDFLLKPGEHMPEPGNYRLRFVLSESAGAYEDAGWVIDESAGVYAFDSDAFVVDEPPSDGYAMVYPDTGDAATTIFTLKTAGWVDDDLPLQYRFSRSPSASTRSDIAWVILSDWGEVGTFSNLLLSDIGVVTIMAEAQDTLGSVTEATTTVTVNENANKSQDELLEAVAAVSGAGEPFATLAAVAAVASAADDHEVGFSQSLLSTMESSVSMTAATAEVVSSFSNALSEVVLGSTVEDTTGSSTLDSDVALQASELLLSVAGVTLTESMDTATAGTLLSVVESLVGATLGTSGSRGGARAITNPNSTEDYMASNVFSSMSAIGDALILDAEVGVLYSVTSGSMVLTAMMQDVALMASNATSVADFSLPATDVGTPLAAASCSASEVGLHVIQWSRSPLAYAGASTTATDSAIQAALEAAGFDTTLDGVSCCEVSETSAQTLSVRGCGVTLEGSTGEAITFTVPLPAEQLNSTTYRDVRLCQPWDPHASAWDANSSCSVVNVTNDHIVCGCSQLSATYAGTYGTQLIPIDFDLPGADLGAEVASVSSAGIAAVFEGTWWKEPAGIFLWVLLALWALIALAVWRRSKASAFVSNEQAKGEDNNGLSLAKLKEAGAARERGASEPYVVWFVAKVLQVRADAGRAFEVPLMAALRELLAVKCLQMSVAAQLRVSSWDLHLLASSKVDVSEKGAKKGQAVVHPAREVPEGSRGAEAAFKEAWDKEPEYFQTGARSLFWRFLRVVHPIAGLSLFSLVLPSMVQIVVLLDSLFGSLAFLALFLSGSACTSGADCADYGALANVSPDVFTTLLCAVLGSIPCLAILCFYGESSSRNQSIVLIGVGYFVFSALAVMVFLANVSKADGERWLVGALMRLTLAWFLQPVFLASLWYAVADVLSRHPEMLQTARTSLLKALVTPERQLTDSEKRFQNWMEEFVGSQRFAAAAGPQQWPPVQMPGPPPLPNRRRPLTPTTSPGTSPRGSGPGALSQLRLAAGDMPPPPPPPAHEPGGAAASQGPASSSAPADWEAPRQPAAVPGAGVGPIDDATRWTLAPIGQDELASLPLVDQPSIGGRPGSAAHQVRRSGFGPFAAPAPPNVQPPSRGTPHGPPPTLESFGGLETVQLPGQRAHMPGTMQMPQTPTMAPFQAPAPQFPADVLVPAPPFAQPPGTPSGAQEMQHWAAANMQLSGPWGQETSLGLVPPPPPMTPDDVGNMTRLRSLYNAPGRQPPPPSGATDPTWSSIRSRATLPPPRNATGTAAMDMLPLPLAPTALQTMLPPLPRALAQVAAANAQLPGATPTAAAQLPLPTTTFPVRMPQLPPQGMFPQVPRAGPAPPPPGPPLSSAEPLPLPVAGRATLPPPPVGTAPPSPAPGRGSRPSSGRRMPQALGDDAAVPKSQAPKGTPTPKAPPTPYTPAGDFQSTTPPESPSPR